MRLFRRKKLRPYGEVIRRPRPHYHQYWPASHPAIGDFDVCACGEARQ